jgi:hypothetical protein
MAEGARRAVMAIRSFGHRVPIVYDVSGKNTEMYGQYLQQGSDIDNCRKATGQA